MGTWSGCHLDADGSAIQAQPMDRKAMDRQTTRSTPRLISLSDRLMCRFGTVYSPAEAASHCRSGLPGGRGSPPPPPRYMKVLQGYPESCFLSRAALGCPTSRSILRGASNVSVSNDDMPSCAWFSRLLWKAATHHPSPFARLLCPMNMSYLAVIRARQWPGTPTTQLSCSWP